MGDDSIAFSVGGLRWRRGLVRNVEHAVRKSRTLSISTTVGSALVLRIVVALGGVAEANSSGNFFGDVKMATF